MENSVFVTDNKASDCSLSVIIAARNEENYIASCLFSLLAQDQSVDQVEVIVAANACTDRTVAIAKSFEPEFAARGWDLIVLDLQIGGKLRSLNAAEGQARGAGLVYLDADVHCDPALLGQLARALTTPEPVYATGTLAVMSAQTWVTRAYAGMWVRLPFVTGGAVGAGLFSVNRPGRERWGSFPDIISDDTFVRLHFAPEERIEVPALYHWPMVEGFRNLVRVRRRQDTGVAEVYKHYPELVRNEVKNSLGLRGLARLLFANPKNFIIYSGINLLARLRWSTSEWTRGR
ncbi:Glycosyltransferase involved in cell wall bisynthesis [Ruegeria halocynthiae]|uniref:Glycosyltransferase involved in cell wall bisynthesis n=1 Tax=Ruegeria halocynthiae TaxID=985054 RepID=A0A1H2Y3G1_9RHOB|nr:glycosyltransferase [Ruegeria halocynthiae]SDW99129.1 Glycosyltransferase involved in cell wall bisynthesis [Ruegeria halocynthiae]